jgi:hypothetical protein
MDPEVLLQSVICTYPEPDKSSSKIILARLFEYLISHKTSQK